MLIRGQSACSGVMAVATHTLSLGGLHGMVQHHPWMALSVLQGLENWEGGVQLP